MKLVINCYAGMKVKCTVCNQGPVVQSIVSLTTSFRGHLVKYIPTTLSNTLLFFVGKIALQKILSFFQQKITVYL